MFFNLKRHIKPPHLVFLIALATGILIYQGGRRFLPYVEKNQHQELTILAYKVAQSYLVAVHSGGDPAQNKHLKYTLTEAAQHPDIVWAGVRLKNNEDRGTVYKNNETVSFQSSLMTLPIVGTRGKEAAFVTFGLAPRAALFPALRRQITGVALFGFLVVFAIGLFFLPTKEPFLAVLAQAIRDVGKGNLEMTLATPNDKEMEGLAKDFNNMIEDLRERDRMRHSLGRIMDPKIAEILIKENPKVGGLRRQATILFCDMRNYTSICEQLTPDELQEFLNEYWKGTVEIIMEQEGTIDKFHGDGVCVVFGAPSLHADDPLRAVRTAWRLVQNVEALNRKREAQRKIPIQIGIGIHTGEVIAGNIGSERRMDYTVVGDAVNVAARIEELNKKFGTHILISDNVYEKVEPYVRVKTLTLAYLRGHKRPILVHTVREFNEAQGTIGQPEQKAA